jgi:hypothetical protein
MNILLKSGKKRKCIKIPEHTMKSFPTGMANQREGSLMKKQQERWPEKKQNKMKLGDLLPSLSRLIQDLSKEEETPTDKRRRDKEKVLKKKNDAKKKQKVEADKEKSKAEAEAKVVVEREKELAKEARVAAELAEESNEGSDRQSC